MQHALRNGQPGSINGNRFMGIVESFTRGYVGARGGLVVHLSRQLGWEIDEQKGRVYGFHFKGDAVTPRRTVYVVHAEGDKFMSFGCYCRAEFTADNLPGDLPLALMSRGQSLHGGWEADIEKDDTITFLCSYTPHADGMDADSFKTICLTLVNEVAEVEASLHRKRLM